MRFSLSLPLLLALIGVFLIPAMGQTRQHLRTPTEQERSLQIMPRVRTNDWGIYAPRAATAVTREFFLDYPKAEQPALRFQLARALSYQSESATDWAFISEEVEQAASRVLASYGPGHTPKQQDFEAAGFKFQAAFSSPSSNGKENAVEFWQEPFLVTDVDEDGSPDVILAGPDGGALSALFLFRHTKQGWIPSLLGIGTHILGMWAFDISALGPKALVLTCQVGSEYDPTLLFDVFVWQNGRMNNVLSTTLSHGWQWEHKDLEQNGRQAIRLISQVVHNYQRKVAAFEEAVYAWDGGRFVSKPSLKRPSLETRWQFLITGRQLFAEGKYREALLAFRQAQVKPSDEDGLDAYVNNPRTTLYSIGLCCAMLGDIQGARDAMAQIKSQNKPYSDIEPDVLTQNARKFLDLCREPKDLQKTLQAIGHVFHLLERTAQTASPGITPKEILAENGLQADFYRELDVTREGKPDVIVQFTWTGGNAVTIWRRDPLSKRWAIWPLAYGLKDWGATIYKTAGEIQFTTYPLSSQVWFYLPHPVALTLPPGTETVAIGSIRPGKPPRIEITYRKKEEKGKGLVVWDEGSFMEVRPALAAKEHLPTTLDRIETQLFERHDFAQALKELDAFCSRVRKASLEAEEKNDLLLEAHYHRALCYRKLGQVPKAESVLTTLSNDFSDNIWGKLAKEWLKP